MVLREDHLERLHQYQQRRRIQRVCGSIMDIDVKCEQPAATPSFSAMDAGMALRAERDKVLFGVVARVAAKLFVVDLQVRRRAARLTPPAIAMQDLLPQTFVRQGIQPQASGFWANHSQDAFSRKFSRKACCCSPGKNL